MRRGHLPETEILTGTGAVPVKVPRAQDRGDAVEKVRFTSKILPPYLRKGNSQYTNGDSAQAPNLWQPPDAWEDIMTDKANEILRAIDKGIIGESGETAR